MVTVEMVYAYRSNFKCNQGSEDMIQSTRQFSNDLGD